MIKKGSEKKKVLVTGASGIVGSHICEALHRAGFETYGLIRSTSSRDWIDHPWLKLHTAELDDRQTLSRILKGIDVVIHCAGVNSGSTEEVCQKVNVQGTRIMAEESLDAGVFRFINISSRSAAGSNRGVFMRTEQTPDYPVNSYCRSKKTAEDLLYEMRDKMEIVSLRYALMYGPRDTHLMPVFRMLSKPIHPIAGLKPIYTPLLYLEDAARAAVATVNGEFESGSVYYVSDGVPYSMDTFYDLFLDAYGHKSWRVRIPLWMLSIAAWIAKVFVKKRVGLTPEAVDELRVGSRLVSPEKFMQDFDWKPEVLPHQAFARTVRWYREQGWLPK